MIANVARRSGAAMVRRHNAITGQRFFSTATMEAGDKPQNFFRKASTQTLKGPSNVNNLSKAGQCAEEAASRAGSGTSTAYSRDFMAGRNGLMYAPLLFVNPVTIFGYLLYQRNSNEEELPYRAQVNGGVVTKEMREARRGSLKDFKEAAYQRDDPREYGYDEATYRRNNYTDVIRKSSFGVGLKEHMAQAKTA